MKLKKLSAFALSMLLVFAFVLPTFAGTAQFNRNIYGGSSHTIATGLAVTQTQVSVTVYVLTFPQITNGAKTLSFRGYYNGTACTKLITFSNTGTQPPASYITTVPMNAKIDMMASIPSTVSTDYAYAQGVIVN